MIYGTNQNPSGRQKAAYELSPFDRMHGPTKSDAERVARQLARAASVTGDDSPYVDSLLRTLKDQPGNRAAHMEALKIIDQAASMQPVSQQAVRTHLASGREQLYEPHNPGHSSTLYHPYEVQGQVVGNKPDTQDETHIFGRVA